MRRFLLLLPSLLLLSACGGGGLTPLPGPHAAASFPAGGVANVIVVDTLDNLPLRAAELVAPDGTVTPSTPPDVARKIQANGGEYALASPLRAYESVGPTMMATLPDPAFYVSHSELLLMNSTADITVPDLVAYRRDWGRYRIRLTFGAPGGPEIREIAAPAPPPG